MSRQLSISALAATVSMAAFALVAGLGGFSAGDSQHMAGRTPLVEFYATR